MKEKIEQLLKKYRRIISYVITSCFTALIELVAGLAMIKLFSFPTVAANTVGIIIGSLVHYLLITNKVFKKKTDFKTAAVYLTTFLIGMLLQNTVIYFSDKLLSQYLKTDLSYTLSKGLSLAVSFIIMYQLRKKLYSKLGRDLNE
ncbi:MAG: GtrA family protein [Ruminococcus sp.]|nr:GtrA family protein [Ruminococcus sp.]